MATSRGKGNNGQRQPSTAGRHRGGNGGRITDETILPLVDSQTPSRQSNLALQKAFNDLTKKFRNAQDEKSKLQAENAALYEENENLKQQLEMGYKAYDDKYKETEKLKEKLDLKENQNTVKEDKSKDDQVADVLEVKHTTIALQEAQEMSRSTQTDEEKTDEVTISPFRNLLEKCGMEIVTQDGKTSLILINRDDCQHWLENETDGKIKVEFEKEPVTERFVQTDEAVTQHVQTCNHKDMIILLKNKISDQGDMIKAQRQIISQMRQNQLPVAAQKESKEIKINQFLKRYHLTLVRHSREVSNQMNLLKEQLESQKKYTKRLLDIIKGSKDLPKQFMLISEVTHEKLKTQAQREIKQPPSFSITAEQLEDDAEEMSKREESSDSDSNLYSIAVQETDETVFSLGSAGNEKSASVVILKESKSSGLPSLQGLVDPNQKNSFDEKEEAKLVSSTDQDEKAEVTATGENDDIVVINEDPSEAGGASGISVGAKQCPVCYISFTPSFSQNEFEAHVVAHFQDE